MNTKTIAIFLIIILAVGGGSFYGGIKYSQSQAMAKFANRGNGNFQPGTNNTIGTKNMARTNGGMIAGEVIAKDSQSITVKSQDGSSKIIFISASTQTSKQSSGSLNDLAVGGKVTVSGTTDASGNITAKFIQMLPTSANGQTTPNNGQPLNGQPPAAPTGN